MTPLGSLVCSGILPPAGSEVKAHHREEPRNAIAGRLTERAFIALRNVTNPVYHSSPGTADANSRN
jgi:hypothetical protein